MILVMIYLQQTRVHPLKLKMLIVVQQISPRKAKNKDRDTGGMYSSVKAIAKSVAGMIPKLDGLINVLSTQDKEVADLLAKVFDEMLKIDGLDECRK